MKVDLLFSLGIKIQYPVPAGMIEIIDLFKTPCFRGIPDSNSFDSPYLNFPVDVIKFSYESGCLSMGLNRIIFHLIAFRTGPS